MTVREYLLEECDFCGEVKVISSSPFGCYCKHCWEMIKDEAYEAIAGIESLVEE